MPVVHTYRCAKCEKVFPDVWSDERPTCCGVLTSWMPTKLITHEWGGPRHIPTLRDEPFESRSDLKAYCERNNLALGARAEKVGGARNEEHLNLGRSYSYAGSPKG